MTVGICEFLDVLWLHLFLGFRSSAWAISLSCASLSFVFVVSRFNRLVFVGALLLHTSMSFALLCWCIHAHVFCLWVRTTVFYVLLLIYACMMCFVVSFVIHVLESMAIWLLCQPFLTCVIGGEVGHHVLSVISERAGKVAHVFDGAFEVLASASVA